MKKLTVFRRAGDRQLPKYVPLDQFFIDPLSIYNLWDEETEETMKNKFDLIISSKNKRDRSTLKQMLLPAAIVSSGGLISIDIDDIHESDKKQEIVELLRKDSNVFILQESVSGNLVVYYKFECHDNDFKYLYYKLYLELTLKLNVTIDFLPDKERLRFLSNGMIYVYNENAPVITEILKVDKFLTPVKEYEGRTFEGGGGGFTGGGNFKQITKKKLKKKKFKS